MDTADAISWLPEEVLGKILSLLPTKQAASTCVLSRKWRYVFRLVDHLDLDDFVWTLVEEDNWQVWYVFPESFKNFVDRTLALQSDYPIKKLSLKCYVGSDKDDRGMAYVGRWITNVVDRGVSELDLRLKVREVHYLPPQLYACTTLVKLTLGTQLYLGTIPSDVSLPSLKILFIDTVFFEYEDFCCRLLAGCPVLEELVVHHKHFVARPHTISTPTVKRLSVHYHCPSDVSDGDQMSFVLPNLVYLDYSDFALAAYDQVDLPSLVEAKLDLHPTERVKRPDLTNLMWGIRHVEILHLTCVSVDVIYACCKRGLALPVFENLVKLCFGCKNERGWQLIAYLVKQSPKLKTVNIIHGYQGAAEESIHLNSFLGEFKRLELVQVDDGGKIKRI